MPYSAANCRARDSAGLDFIDLLSGVFRMADFAAPRTYDLRLRDCGAADLITAGVCAEPRNRLEDKGTVEGRPIIIGGASSDCGGAARVDQVRGRSGGGRVAPIAAWGGMEGPRVEGAQPAVVATRPLHRPRAVVY